jgi:hypothetical protein
MSSIIKLKKSSIGSAETAGVSSKTKVANTDLNLILNACNKDDLLVVAEKAEQLKSISSSNSSPSSVKLFLKSKLMETKRIFSFRTKNDNSKSKDKSKDSELNVVEDNTATANNESFTSSAPTHTYSNNLKSETYTSSSSSLSSSSFSFLNESISNTNENRNKAASFTKCKICFNRYPDFEASGQTTKTNSHYRVFQLDSCKCKFCIDVRKFFCLKLIVSKTLIGYKRFVVY